MARRMGFEERGFLNPTRVFTARECAVVLRRLRQVHDRPPMDWHKGWAASSPVYAAIAADDRILDLVTPLLGEDVMLWGASLVVRTPTQVHPWHTDIESSCDNGRTVSVWIGLARTSALSSLIVVPGSHRFGVTIQQLVQKEDVAPSAVHDDLVASWARARDSQSGVVPLHATDGEAVVFYAAGEPHGVKNAGDVPARYVAFELHGRHCDVSGDAGEPYDPRLSRRVWKVLRHPARLKEALTRRLGR